MNGDNQYLESLLLIGGLAALVNFICMIAVSLTPRTGKNDQVTPTEPVSKHQQWVFRERTK